MNDPIKTFVELLRLNEDIDVNDVGTLDSVFFIELTVGTNSSALLIEQVS